MQIFAGGDSVSKKNWRVSVATAQLRSQRERSSQENAIPKKSTRPAGSCSTTDREVVTGVGTAPPNRDVKKNESGMSVTPSTWNAHPEERTGLLQPSWLTKLRSQKKNLRDVKPNDRPSLSGVNDEKSEPKSRPSLIPQTPYTTQLGTSKTVEPLLSLARD